MKKIVLSLMFIIAISAPVVVFADTENHGSSTSNSSNAYSGKLSNGGTITLNLSAKTVRKPSTGQSEIRNQANWTETGSWGSISGGSFPFVWSNFEDGNGNEIENNPAQGAAFNLMFAFPSAACSNGVMYFAVIQTPNAASMSNFGDTVNFTPLFGQICGTQVTKVDSYVLTKVTPPSTTSTSTSSTSTTGGTGTGSTANSADFSGYYKNTADGAVMKLTQTGTSLTGNGVQSSNTLSITGTVSGSIANVRVGSSSPNCTDGRGYGTFTLAGTTSVITLTSAVQAVSGVCGGTLLGTFTKQ